MIKSAQYKRVSQIVIVAWKLTLAANQTLKRTKSTQLEIAITYTHRQAHTQYSLTTSHTHHIHTKNQKKKTIKKNKKLN